jgi:hypothetical protein
VLDRSPSFFDRTYAFVDEPLVGLPRSELADVVGWAQRLGFEAAARAVSWLAGLVYERPIERSAQLELARAVFAAPLFRGPIEDAIRSRRAALVLAPQTITCLARIVLLHAADSDRLMGPVDGLRMGRLTLAATGLCAAAADEPTEGDMLALLTQSGALNARIPALESLGRWSYLYGELAVSDLARARADYTDVSDWGRNDAGISPADQATLGFAALASSYAYGLLAPDWCADMGDRLGVDEANVRELISAPRGWFVERLQAWAQENGLSPEQAAAAYYSKPFDVRPFLQLGDGSLMLWSPRALVTWATEGIFHRLHQSAKHRRCDESFRGFHAWLIERYCADLMGEALPPRRLAGSGIVSREKTYASKTGDRRSPDIAIAFGRDLVLIEVSSGRLTLDSLALGHATDVERDLERLLIDKASQLSHRIDDLENGLYTIDGATEEKTVRIWPIVVTAPGVFMTGPLWNDVMRRLGGQLQQPRVQPLVVLDVDALEVLTGLIEHGGWALPDLLERKTAGPYRFLDWSRFVADDPYVEPKRPSSISRNAEADFDRMAVSFGFDATDFKNQLRNAA